MDRATAGDSGWTGRADDSSFRRGGDDSVHQPVSQRDDGRAERSANQRHPRVAHETPRTGEAQRKHPLFHRRAGEADARTEKAHRRFVGQYRGGRPLSALQTQAGDKSRNRPAERTRTAGADASATKGKKPCCLCRLVCQRRDQKPGRGFARRTRHHRRMGQ